MEKTMRPEQKEIERNEGWRSTEAYRRDQQIARKPAPKSNIPRRTSAHAEAIAAVQPKYIHRFSDLERVTHLDVTRLPTLPHKSGGVGAILHPDPTVSKTLEASQRRTDDLITEHIFHNIEDIVSIDEIDTLPPDVQAQLGTRLTRLRRASYQLSTLSEVDTLPDPAVQPAQSNISQAFGRLQQASIPLPNSIDRIQQPQKISIWYASDRLRWWLLYPGRLEFLLWLIGVIVLICITGFFVLIATISMGLFGLRGAPGTTPSDAAMQKSTCVVTSGGTITSRNGEECLSITALSSRGLQVTMMNGAIVIPGTTFKIEGRGFSAHGGIDITHDGDHPCVPAETQADGHGEFTMTIDLMDNTAWSPGTHQITLYDVQSHNSITLPIMLTSS